MPDAKGNQVVLTFETTEDARQFADALRARNTVTVESIYGMETFHIVNSEKGSNR